MKKKMENNYFYRTKKEGYIFIKNPVLQRKNKFCKLKILNYTLLLFLFFAIFFFLIKKNIFNKSSTYNISNKLNETFFSEEELKYH